MKFVKIGGQAVIEGVMMKNEDDYAIAVRKPDNEIEVKTGKYVSIVKRLHLKKVPIIRGVFAFIDSMVLGISTLTYSASFYEEEEPKKDKEGEETVVKAEEKKDDKKSSAKDTAVMGFTILLSLAIAIGLFMVLPFAISNLLKKYVENDTLIAVLEGVVRVVIFLGYIISVSCMKDIKRVYMYHGAEHKTINCIEKGKELNPENAMKCSRQHKRCGTSFMFLVIIISVILFIFIRVDGFAMKIAVRLLLIPVIAGISYEIIQLAGKHDNLFFNILSAPGFLLQKVTTKEPTEDMLEVAIASVEAIYDWREFQKELKNGKAKS